jgi:hypothetical protein
MKKFEKTREIDLDLEIFGKKITTNKIKTAKDVRDYFKFCEDLEDGKDKIYETMENKFTELAYLYPDMPREFWEGLKPGLLDAIVEYIAAELMLVKKK